MTATDEPHGVVGQVARLGDKLITTLPPAFILLVLLNIAFLGMVMWFIQDQSAQHNATVSAMLTRCMEIAYQAQPSGK